MIVSLLCDNTPKPPIHSPCSADGAEQLQGFIFPGFWLDYYWSFDDVSGPLFLFVSFWTKLSAFC